jgi:hypothetical protein
MHNACSYHVVLHLHNRDGIGAKMIKGTCLVDPQKETETRQTVDPRNLQRMAPLQRFVAQTINNCQKHVYYECRK